MPYSSTLRDERFVFPDLRDLFAKANEEKSGDQLAGVAATSERQRVAAKMALAEVTLRKVVEQPLIDPDKDDVSRLILDQLDQSAFAEVSNFTLGQFRDRLLAGEYVGDALPKLQRCITPEIAAGLAKLMSNKDLILAASTIRNITRCRNTVGEPGVLAIRVQPNHPADDVAGILLSAIDGLTFGCGDAVIGVNPAGDSVERVSAILHGLDRLITSLEIPTQHCCLAHITTQLAAMKRGAPIDLLFQSVAGTQAANASFGVSLALLEEGRQQVLEHHHSRDVAWIGDNLMYFETGQGSALSADAHHGIDQLTLEARAYGMARQFQPFLVNSVVGFIGPEYLYDGKQIIRAGLEDHFCGKLLGAPLGVDVCYTNHAEADQDDMDTLLVLLGTAGITFIIGIPGADDVMLNYQSTSFHDQLYVREVLGLKRAPEFEAWLRRMDITDPSGKLSAGQGGQALLAAMQDRAA